MKTTKEMLNYLKALNDDEVVFFLGDGGHPMAGGRLMSVSSDGMRDFGNLGNDGVTEISLTNESYELIKEQYDGKEITLEELWGLDIDEFFEFIAYKKGCLPNKDYYCALTEWNYDYHRNHTNKLEWILEEINVYNIYEEAFQDLGAQAEEGYLHEWDDLSDNDIRKCYDAVIEHKKIIAQNK